MQCPKNNLIASLQTTKLTWLYINRKEVNNKLSSSSHKGSIYFEVSCLSKKPAGNYKPVFNPFLSFYSIFENSKKSLSHHSPIHKTNFNSFSSFASIFENQSLYQHNKWWHHAMQPVYNFYNCEVNKGWATPTQKPKRKRLRIYSSSEDE